MPALLFPAGSAVDAALRVLADADGYDRPAGETEADQFRALLQQRTSHLAAAGIINAPECTALVWAKGLWWIDINGLII